MVNKLVGALLAIVIGVALLPAILNVTDALDPVTTPETVLALVDILPIIYVIIIVAGAVGYVAFAGKK